MKLSKEEYDFFNEMNYKDFYAFASIDFDRYFNFITNESKFNKRERHLRFNEQRERDFTQFYNCKKNCSRCKSPCGN